VGAVDEFLHQKEEKNELRGRKGKKGAKREHVISDHRERKRSKRKPHALTRRWQTVTQKGRKDNAEKCTVREALRRPSQDNSHQTPSFLGNEGRGKSVKKGTRTPSYLKQKKDILSITGRSARRVRQLRQSPNKTFRNLRGTDFSSGSATGREGKLAPSSEIAAFAHKRAPTRPSPTKGIVKTGHRERGEM